MWLVNSTSRWTSLAMPSTEPGFVKPIAFLFADRLSNVSFITVVMALFVRNANGDELGSSTVTTGRGTGTTGIGVVAMFRS